MDVRGYGRGARNGRGCARSHYRDTTQYGKRSRTREPYLAAVPWSRTAPPRARPGHDSRCRKALASKRRSCATETRKTATEAKERALSAWRSSRRRKARYGCTSGGAVTSGWGCEEYASSRRKGPRAQATETPQHFVGVIYSAGAAAAYARASVEPLARCEPAPLGRRCTCGLGARGHGARVFVAAFAITR